LIEAADTDDGALVRSSQSGDRAAFETLVRRTARLVFSRIYLETGDVHRSEDLVQETFLTAWRSIHHVSDPSGFRSWLLQVAHTTVIDAARRDSRKKRSAGGRREDPEVLRLRPSDDPAPPEVAGNEEARRKVLSVLRSLPEDYRRPLMLRYFAGADYESIGRELGLTNGSLRGLLSRGMHLLRAELNRLGGKEAWH
jgi:RNA polymerase sigma-70 factor, ECF subfamily